MMEPFLTALKRQRSTSEHNIMNVCDLIQGELDRRFSQDKFKPVLNLEKVLIAAANGRDFSEDLGLLRESCYKTDIDCTRLLH